MKNKLEDKLHEIAECIYDKICNKETEINSLGLYSGDCGILLFLYHYCRYTNDSKYIDITDIYTDRLLNSLEDKIGLHTFCNGLSGSLFLFDYFKEQGFVDIDITESRGILENYLIKKMREDMQTQNFDFLHGALGVAYYFLQARTNDEIILEFINFLYNTVEISVNEKTAKWKSLIDPQNEFAGYNISLAHGMSSIALFLSKTIEQKISHPYTEELLFKTVNYILKQEIEREKYGSFFPNYSKESSKELVGSRLSWCYGDLGIAWALWYTGNILMRKEWIDKGLDIIIHSTTRFHSSNNGVIDSCICHGSAGLSMIYRRIYLETGKPEFLLATNYWLDKTLNFAHFKNGLVGYKSFVIDKWVRDYSLLMGISGVGLSILTHLNNDNQNWDKIFLLS